MKKLFIISVIALIFSNSSLKAQERPFVFGFKVAPNIGWMNPSSTGYETDGSKFGFSWGLMAEFHLMENYSINTGLNILFQNGTLNYEDELDAYGGVGFLSRTYNLKYIEIPVILKMKTNEISGIRFFGVFGFGANILLSAKVQDKFALEAGVFEDKGKKDFKNNLKSMRASMIVGIGAEFNVDGVTKLLAGVNFNNGITDVLKNQNNYHSDINHKSINNYLEFYIGILF